MTGPSMQRPFAAAMSVDADPGGAAGEVIGSVLEQLGGVPPDLAVLFVAGSHAEHLADLVAAVHATLDPGVALAVTAVGVLGGAREAESGPGLSLWAGVTGPVRPVRMEAFETGGQSRLSADRSALGRHEKRPTPHPRASGSTGSGTAERTDCIAQRRGSRCRIARSAHRRGGQRSSR